MDSLPAGARGALRELLGYIFRYRGAFLFAIAASALISATSLASIAMLMPLTEAVFNLPPSLGSRVGDAIAPVYAIIEHFAEGNRLAALAVVCVLFIAITALRCTLRFAQVYCTHWIGNRVILDLQHELFDRMTGYHAAYFGKKQVGALLSYYTADIRLISVNIFNSFSQLLLDPLQIAALAGALLWMNWPLTLAYALTAPALVLTVRVFARKNRKASREAQDALERIGGFLQDHFRLIRLVQAYGMKDAQRKRFERETQSNYHAMMRKVKAVALSSPLNELIGVTAVCAIIMLAGYVIFVTEAMAASAFVVFLGALISLYQPIRRIERSIQEMQHGIAAAERVFGALHENASLAESPQSKSVDSLQREIRFIDVSFQYESDTMALDGVSLNASKGETIALVGPSGAGKTSLVNLIPRFYDPTEGRIELDGVDLREIRLSDLRALISYVPQEQSVFFASVRDNLTCGDDRYSDEQIAAAARAAHAHDFIAALPDGYDTEIGGERGVALSGGQNQRLAVARAFLRDAPILILDEATSALDSESEQRVKDSLERLMKGRTVFVIAHRLSTVLHADRIAVMDRGRIIDIAPHADLIVRCELYQRLYQLQFEGDGRAAERAPIKS